MGNQDLKRSEQAAGKTGFFEWMEVLVSAILLVILFCTFVARPNVEVVGTSMYPTLEDGDRMFVSNLFYTPKQGDVIVFTKASYGDESLVKRIIAVAGQTVDIDPVAGTVSIDGVVLEEDYISEPTRRLSDVPFPVTVPEGCVFVLGDNRNESRDSRYGLIGMVDTRYIIGRAYVVIAPFARFGPIN